MRGFVAPTDHGWYEHLRARPGLEEVNFWRPGATPFAALAFFFKLKAPHEAIGGFGRFAGYERIPVWAAWDAFGEANGVPDEASLRARLSRLSTTTGDGPDRRVGCISIAYPTFFAPGDWVPAPSDWSRNIVSGRRYDLDQGVGRALWDACVARVAGGARIEHPEPVAPAARGRFGTPQVIAPRLGQASFRLAVLDAYGGVCAVTRERSLPVVDAAHIRPYSQGGTHSVSNGLPLRRDLHRLFDLGLVTVRPDRTFAVSPRLRSDYGDGDAYYALEGRTIAVPERAAQQPEAAALAWHGDVVFRG